MAEKLIDQISLSNLIDGFGDYRRTVSSVIRHPLTYPNSLAIDGEEAYRHALHLCSYCIALSFFLLIPIFAIFSAEVPKLTFLIRMLTQFSMYGILMHFCLKLIGRTDQSLRASLVVYAHVIAVGVPLAIIFQYPLLFSFGPAALFGTSEDISRLEGFYLDHQLIWIYMLIYMLAFSVLSLLIILNWYKTTHNVNRFRIFLSLVIAGWIGMLAQIFILNPFFLVVFEWLNQFLKYV
jgi:hypothetical protein